MFDGPGQKPSEPMELHHFTIFTGKYGDRRDVVFPDEVVIDTVGGHYPPPWGDVTRCRLSLNMVVLFPSKDPDQS
jgi:hypothetical protein